MLKSPFKLYGQSFVASLGALVCGFTISQLGIAYNYLAENYYIDKFDKYGKVTAQFRNICTIVVAILSVGAMISAYFSKYIFHKLERRQIMILADFIFILGSVLGLVQDQYAFTFARFIMGLSVGLNTTVILPYLREISPDNYSKKICSFFNNQFFNGVILGMVTSLPLKQFSSNDTPQNNLWMLVIIFPACICFLRIILLIFVFNLDTPFFYYSNNMHYEGRKALERLYEENSVQELENSIIGGGVNQSDNKRSLIAFDSIVNQQKCPSQRNRLITGMCINFLQQMTGITMLMAYLTAVFGEVTDDFKKQNLLVLCGYNILLFSSFAQLLLNTSMPRKIILQVGYGICAILLLVLGIISSLNVKNSTFLQASVVIIVFLFFIVNNLTIGPFTGILTSEIVKDEAMSYSVLMNWLGGVVSLCFNFNQIYWINYIVFSFFSFAGVICCSYFVKETKQKTFQEIQLLYLNKNENQQYINDSTNTSTTT